MASPKAASDPLRVGVLVTLPVVQLLDMSPVDLFSMCTREYLADCSLPSSLLNLALDVETSYISSLPAGSQLHSTGALTFLSTASFSDADVQPGKLDILLIPGPPPDHVPSEEEKAFLRAHAAADSPTDILSVCTGIFVAGHAGILDGRTVTAPRGLVPRCRRAFPKATFREDVRWLADNDHHLWSSGGITNGQEMVAAYLRHRFPGPLAETVCALSDVGEKPQSYDSSPSADTAWFVWQIVRALWTRKKVK